MIITSDVHKQFAQYFKDKDLAPYLYLLSKRLSEGHICVDVHDVNRDELSEAGYNDLPSIEQIRKSVLVSDGNEKQPFIFNHERLYLQRYFHYETRIIQKILSFIQNEKENNDASKLSRARDFIEQYIADKLVQGTDWQLVAAISAVLNNFTIITGGPGTGKTTTVSKVLSILYHIHPDLKVALAAPTGKAAARMAESLKNTRVPNDRIRAKFELLEPSTIHLLLGFSPRSIYPKKNADNPLHADVVVIDETSMVDVALFSKLLDAIPHGAKLILLGDRNQLSSVEAGSLFGDLCISVPQINRFTPDRAAFINQMITNEHARILDVDIAESKHPLFQHVVELRKSHRFSDQAGIGKVSKAIIQGDKTVFGSFYDNHDEKIITDTAYSAKTLEDFAIGFKSYIEEKDTLEALKKLNELRVLCAVREGPQGIYAINDKIQTYLKSKGLIRPTRGYYQNRPVIVNKNNYQLGLRNGDVGIALEDSEGRMKVWFEDSNEVGKLFSVIPEYIDAADTVFAMTIHKSQGSEFDKIMIVLPAYDLPLLSRELFYTGVTRAKNRVIIQGSREIIAACLDRRVKRGSGLQDRLSEMFIE